MLAKQIAEVLRETWERFVEEILFNGALVRFDPAVHTQKLRGVADSFKEADMLNLDEGMTVASDWCHDSAMAVNKRIPEPAELEAEVDRLKKLKDNILSRRLSP